MSKIINFIFIATFLLFSFAISNSTKLIKNNDQSGNTPLNKLVMSIDKQINEIDRDGESAYLRVPPKLLGKIAWTFLHSVAAAYPINPTDEDKVHISNLINSIPYLYPCKMCAGHFGTLLKSFPIKNNSRKELAEYLCFLHNKVNERLEKPQVDCSNVLNYWGGVY